MSEIKKNETTDKPSKSKLKDFIDDGNAKIRILLESQFENIKKIVKEKKLFLVKNY